MHIQQKRRIKNFAVAVAYMFCVITCSFPCEVKAEEYTENEIAIEQAYIVEEPETIEIVIEEPEQIQEEPVEEIIEIVEEEPEVRYFDVPLDESLQDLIFELCEERGIDPAIIIAMIEKESRFRADIKGDKGRSYGLMQIQPRYHQDRADRLGCPDLMNPYHNVTVGIDLLGDLIESGGSIEWALMAYNGGASYANKKASKGIVSDYAKEVISNSEALYDY